MLECLLCLRGLDSRLQTMPMFCSKAYYDGWICVFSGNSSTMENWRSLAFVRDFFKVKFIIVLEMQIKVIQLQGSDITPPTPTHPQNSIQLLQIFIKCYWLQRYSNKHTLSLSLLYIRLIYLSTLFMTMGQNNEKMYHLSNYDIIIALIHSINLKQQQIMNELQSIPTTPSISDILKQKYTIYLKNKQLIEQLFLIEEKEILIPYTYLWQLGGKKVRVIAALLISDLFNRQAKDEVLKIGGLIEMLHCASLIIDDIEDGSLMRRGQPCSHKVYGVDSAINAANLIYFLPISRLLEGVADSDKRWQMNQIYLKQMMWCHVGQGLDIKYHKAEKKQDLPSVEEYIKIVSMKTAGLMKMLVKMLGVSMEIDTQSVSILTECMSNVGIAFQIIDDLLNVTQTQECMGKGVIAEDLHEKKFTIIVHKLKEDNEFLSLFFQREKEAATISRLLAIIKQSGVLLECKQQAQKYIDKAIQCLEKLQCPGNKYAFREFIKFIVDRKS